MIKSILDLDFYKLLMGQFAFFKYPNVKVRYKFKNRKSNIRLADIISIDSLEYEINKVHNMSISSEEIVYLSTLKNSSGDIFEPEYLEFLSNLKLPKVDISIIDGQFDIEVIGNWCEAIFWETIILSIINGLYYVSKYGNIDVTDITTEKTLEKKKILSDLGAKISCFGTRRRYSYENQNLTTTILKDMPNFIGTSNVHLAMIHGLQPIGTNAHELYMIMSGIYFDNLRTSQKKTLSEWNKFYEYDLSIALTDTFGSNAFFEDFDHELASEYRGVRHDSGSPFDFADRVIEKYKSLGIDPKDKIIVFSDGLTLDLIVELHNRYSDKINVLFGWGTNLTNDVGYETLSIVMKAVEVIEIEGLVVNRNLVKLSDNLNKATGSEEDINHYVKVFNYSNTSREECKV